MYRRWFLSIVIGFGLSLGTHTALRAESPDTAPAELTELITQIDTAANQQDIEKIKSLYSDQYETTDGVMLDDLTQSLQQLWKDYPTLEYQTEILSWEKEGSALVAETLTTVEGNSNKNDRKIQLNSEIKSRQTFQDGKLTRQEILTEETQLTSGENPPEAKVLLPETVKVGESFDFDVIVDEPLSDELLAGMAIAEKVEGDRYLEPSAMDLEMLQAGGLFKRVPAVEDPQNRWLSAILVRSDGITIVTRRVRVLP